MTSAIVSASLSSTTAITTISDKVYYSAETGAEEALIKLLRDPTYSGGNFNIDGVDVNIIVSSPSPTERNISSDATINNVKRKIAVRANFINNTLTVTDWKEEIP